MCCKINANTYHKLECWWGKSLSEPITNFTTWRNILYFNLFLYFIFHSELLLQFWKQSLQISNFSKWKVKETQQSHKSIVLIQGWFNVCQPWHLLRGIKDAATVGGPRNWPESTDGEWGRIMRGWCVCVCVYMSACVHACVSIKGFLLSHSVKPNLAENVQNCTHKLKKYCFVSQSITN